VRLRAVLAVLAVASVPVTAACGSIGEAAASAAPYAVSVTCRDAPSDAGLLQHAINTSRTGEVIDIGGGTCLLTRGITMPPDRALTGASTTGTVLRQDGSLKYVLASSAYASDSTTTGGPLTIRNLTVSCDGSGRTDGIIVMNWQADVENVDVTDCGGSGIVDSGAAGNGASIRNTSVNSRFDNNFISGSGQYGFDVADNGTAVTDGYLDDNQISSSALNAIQLSDASGWNISGNHLYGDAQDGIYASRLYGTTISGNYIEDFGARQDSGTWYGIAGTAQGSIGSTIDGNQVFNDGGETGDATHVYIAVTQVNYGTSYLSVTGNVIVGAGQRDVGFSFSGGANHLVVASAGNLVSNVGTVTQRSGSASVSAGT
jgi:parallel beta-helix repeat protein